MFKALTKKEIFGFCTFLAVILFVICLQPIRRPQHFTKADSEPFTLSLNSENHINNNGVHNLYTDKYKNLISFDYQGVDVSESGHCLLEKEGYFQNTKALNGITPFTLNFTGSIYYSFGYSDINWSKEYLLESGSSITLTIPPDYLKFTASELTQINSGVISYSCSERTTKIDPHTIFNINGKTMINAMELSYVDLLTIDIEVTDGANYEIFYTKDDGATVLGSTPDASWEVGIPYAVNVRIIPDDIFNEFSSNVDRFRYFYLIETPKTAVEVTFSGDTNYYYDGQPHSPSVSLSPNVPYTVRYDTSEVFYSNSAPSEIGYYSMIISLVDTNLYYISNQSFIVFSITGDDNTMLWNFSKVESVWGTNNNGVKVHNSHLNSDGTVSFAVDGQTETGGVIKSNVNMEPGKYIFDASANITEGVLMAFWLHDDNNQGDGVVNNEIDIELFNQPDENNNMVSHIWCSSYLNYLSGEDQKYLTSKKTLDFNLSDNQRQIYEIHWYGGEKVDYYVDGVLVETITDFVPTAQMKLWIGLWCPGWLSGINGRNSTMTLHSYTRESL